MFLCTTVLFLGYLKKKEFMVHKKCSTLYTTTMNFPLYQDSFFIYRKLAFLRQYFQDNSAFATFKDVNSFLMG